jgi:hypothetical protein
MRINIGLSNLLCHVVNTLYQSVEKFKAGKFSSLSDSEVSILVEGLWAVGLRASGTKQRQRVVWNGGAAGPRRPGGLRLPGCTWGEPSDGERGSLGVQRPSRRKSSSLAHKRAPFPRLALAPQHPRLRLFLFLLFFPHPPRPLDLSVASARQSQASRPDTGAAR